MFCWQFCRCARSLACPGHPGLRCSRFPVGKADVPVLVNQAASPVSESWISGSQTEVGHAEGSRCCGRGVLMLAEQTCVCGTFCVAEPSLVLEVQATQQTITDWTTVTTTPSCCLTLETSSQSVSVPCYYGKTKQWTICKQSHVCLLEADNCVSSLPLSLACPHYTQDREIACNWLWIDCGWRRGVCGVSAVMVSEGVQQAGHRVREVSSVASSQTDTTELSCCCCYYCYC